MYILSTIFRTRKSNRIVTFGIFSSLPCHHHTPTNHEDNIVLQFRDCFMYRDIYVCWHPTYMKMLKIFQKGKWGRLLFRKFFLMSSVEIWDKKYSKLPQEWKVRCHVKCHFVVEIGFNESTVKLFQKNFESFSIAACML